MSTSDQQLPNRYQAFMEEHRAIWEAYDQLGAAIHRSGPLDAKTRELIKLGMAAATRQEGAVHSHVRKALSAGASEAEIRQVILLAIPTIGFPTMMAAMTWVDDILKAGAAPARAD